MYKYAVLFACGVCACLGEVRTLTLREAVGLALKQNPDVLLARLDARKADENVRLARDPFLPKVVAGSGLAYTSGFPMSIEGATPSIVQARAIASVFNRPQSLRIASAKESRRGAEMDAGARQDEVVYRVAEMYLEAARSARVAEVARGQVGGLESVVAAVGARVSEGRELPIEAKRAELNLARSRYRAQAADSGVHAAERALAAVLGLDPSDEVRAVDRELPEAVPPPAPDEAVRMALRSSKELRAMQARLVAKGYDARAERAAWMPSLDLVAQYGLLAKFNNYDVFFQHFQRHNGQLGVSFQVPVWSGWRPDAAASQAEAEGAQLRVEICRTQTRIASDARRACEDFAQVTTAREIAQMDLDLARDQVSILLAQMQEGRADIRKVEEARAAETDKWIALYEAEANLQKARLALLRQTGQLTSALQ
jgi:outer membrane protein